jgi:hypothetical protein
MPTLRALFIEAKYVLIAFLALICSTKCRNIISFVEKNFDHHFVKLTTYIQYADLQVNGALSSFSRTKTGH